MTQAAPGPEKPSRRITLLRIGGTVLSLGLLVFLVYKQGWSEFWQALQEVPLSSFLLALGLILVSRVFVTFRWYILLRTADVKMSFWQALRLTFTGLFSSNFLPSTVGGDLVRLMGAIYLKVDAGISAASLIVDRLVGMAGMVLLLPVGLGAIVHAGTSFSPVLAGMAGSGSIFQWARERLVGWGKSALQSSIYWIRHPLGLGLGLLATFGHMLCTFLAVGTLLQGAGQPLPFLTIGGLWSLSYFISLAPISINGLGLQEVSIAYLYSHDGGVSMQAGLALAILLRILFLVSSLPGAAFLPGILAQTSRKAESQPSP